MLSLYWWGHQCWYHLSIWAGCTPSFDVKHAIQSLSNGWVSSRLMTVSSKGCIHEWYLLQNQREESDDADKQQNQDRQVHQMSSGRRWCWACARCQPSSLTKIALAGDAAARGVLTCWMRWTAIPEARDSHDSNQEASCVECWHRAFQQEHVLYIYYLLSLSMKNYVHSMRIGRGTLPWVVFSFIMTQARLKQHAPSICYWQIWSQHRAG